MGTMWGGRDIFRDHRRRDAPTGGEGPGDGHASRRTGRDEVVEEAVSGGLRIDALIAVVEQVELRRLQFDAGTIRYVVDPDLTEVRQTRFRAHRREFGASNVDCVFTVRSRVGEGLDARGHKKHCTEAVKRYQIN